MEWRGFLAEHIVVPFNILPSRSLMLKSVTAVNVNRQLKLSPGFEACSLPTKLPRAHYNQWYISIQPGSMTKSRLSN